MRKPVGFLLIVALSAMVVMALVYFSRAAPAGSPVSSVLNQEKAAGTTVVDEMGRKVIFPVSPKRIVVLTSYPAEVICALNAGNRIVGICNPQHEDLPGLRNKPSVGNSNVTPDLEKILELKPDLVIAYQWTKKEAINELEKCNIPVLCFRGWTFEELHYFAEQMGKLLGQQARAQELWQFIQTKMDFIEARTKQLPREQQPKVFYESFIPYQSSSVGAKPLETPWGTYHAENSEEAKLALAGGINCVGQQPTRSAIFSAEWVVQKNPDIIIKVPRTTPSLAIPSLEEMREIRAEILQREGLKEVAAVKAGRVYIIHCNMCAGPRQIIGLCYYVRWLHPELFADLDPKAVHREMLERFWGLKLQGTWGYPEVSN